MTFRLLGDALDRAGGFINGRAQQRQTGRINKDSLEAFRAYADRNLTSSEEVEIGYLVSVSKFIYRFIHVQ